MRREVELRNEVFQCELVLGDLELLRIASYPLLQLDGPAASDIVGNLDGLDLLVFYGREKNVIHVDKSYTS